MYDNTMFDNEDITKWEKKTKYDKTWVNATAYFENLIASIETYHSNRRVTTNQEQYYRINNIREEHQE